MVEIKTLLGYFNSLKERFNDGNLTFREIHLNTGISEEILRIYFSDKNNVISDLSRLFEFGKFNFHLRKKTFNVYRIYEDVKQIKIVRVVEPKASVYYSKINQEYYKFSFKKRRFKECSLVNKDLILNEMHLFLQDYLNKS